MKRLLTLIFVSSFLAIFPMTLANASVPPYTPPRSGVDHATGCVQPYLNNFNDSWHAFYAPDEMPFAMVSFGDLTGKGDSLSVNPEIPETLIFHSYFNNCSTTSATGVKIYTDAFHQNASGQWVTDPFTNSLTVTHYITGSMESGSPVVISDPATVQSGSGHIIRLRYASGDSRMWTYSLGNGAYNQVANDQQGNFFTTGIAIGSRDVPLSGTFAYGDDQTGNDQRVEFQYRMFVEPANADLSITKTAVAAPVGPLKLMKKAIFPSVGVGGTVTYTVDYGNAGPIEATGVTVVDDYDQSKVALSNIPAYCTDDGDIFTCDIPGELANGGSGSFTYDATCIQNGSIVNTAIISSDMYDWSPAGNTSTQTVDCTIGNGAVVINELMWDEFDPADEWIELRNMTATAIDLTGFTLTKNNGGGETAMLTIPGGTIPANGFFLISNYDSGDGNTEIATTPDLVDSDVDLDNSQLQIKLYSGTTLLDVAGDGNAPLAGESGAVMKSMARKLFPGDGTNADNWFTHQLSMGFDSGVTTQGSPGNSSSTFAEAFPETVYEDAENGDTVGWSITDATPAGATIANVLEDGDRYIKTDGTSLDNQYRLYRYTGKGWGNAQQFIAEWKMRNKVATSGSFWIYVRIDTGTAVKYLLYINGNCAPYFTTEGDKIVHCLGNVRNDEFYTHTRDLQADYVAVAGGGGISKVHGFLARGDVDVDDIKLMTLMDDYYSISGNVTYDHDTNPGTPEVALENARLSFVNTADSWNGRPPVYTDASGDYTQNGFYLGEEYEVTVNKGDVIFASNTANVTISGDMTQDFSGGVLPAPATVYSTGDNLIGWDIYDTAPVGAAIASILDASGNNTNVIEFIGNELIYGVENGNGARLRNADGTYWNNTGQFYVQWDIRGIDGLDADALNDSFTLYVSVDTTAGQRYLKYTNVDVDYGNDYGREIHHGIGSNANDGTWRTFNRDLEADLNDDPPSGSPETILDVNMFLIRGSARLDNIQLCNSNPC